MNKKELIFLVLFTAFICCLFFWKVIFLHQIPFPGDLLINTTPFKTESYLGYAPGGYPNKAQGRDVITQSLPWRYFTVSQVQKGQLPLWNPYNFSGNAHIGDFQTGAFYPLSFVFFIFPFPVAWTIFIILQPILAMWFGYLFFRVLDRGKVGSILGGVSFAFCSYMVVWLEYGNINHALLWLPLLLFAITKYLKTQKKSFLALFIFAGSMCLLAGYIQGAFYALATAFLYGSALLLQQKKNTMRKFVPFSLAFVIMLLIAAVQIFPTLVVFSHSTRGNYTQAQIQNLLQPWYYLVTAFSSEFFGNPATRNFYLSITYFERVMYVSIPILFFALYGLRKVKTLEVKFFAILAGIILIVTTNIPGISWLYVLPIPVIATTVPTRLLSIFAFSLIVLGVYGIDLWLEEKKTKHIIPVLFGGVYIVLWGVLLLVAKIHPNLATNLSVSKHALLLSTIFALATIAIFYSKRINRFLSLGLLSIIIFLDLFYVFAKFTPFAPATLLYPLTPVVSYLKHNAGINRSWGYGNAYIPANYDTAFGINSPEGYDALHNMDYNRLLNSSVKGKVVLPLSRGDANIAPGYGPTDLKTNSYRQQILNLLGVKYILNLSDGNSANADNETFPPDRYRLVWHKDQWQIYQNLQAFPRFFLTNSFGLVNNKNDIEKIYATNLRKTILLYQNPEIPLADLQGGSVSLKIYQPNTVSFTTNTMGNELLFLSDTYDRGWQATIDGRPTKVYKADVAFRAVEVPKGQHIIVFAYQPEAFNVGLAISLLTTIVGGSYLLVRKLLHGYE